MASLSRFADPEGYNLKLPWKDESNYTDWRMKAWTDWAYSRLISPADIVTRVLPTTSLLHMPQRYQVLAPAPSCMRRQLVPGLVVRLTAIKPKTRPEIEATMQLAYKYLWIRPLVCLCVCMCV